MTVDPFDELRAMNPYSEPSDAPWPAADRDGAFRETVARTDGAPGPIPLGRRRWTSLRIAATVAAVAGLGAGLVALADRTDDTGVRTTAPPASEVRNEAELESTCDEANLATEDGPVDWSEVEQRFATDGPFRLPERPEWVPPLNYCGAVLYTSHPEPPSPDGSENTLNGPNRFVVFDTGADGATVPVVMNELLIRMYPASIQPAFDPEGQPIGHFAPGVEFVPGPDVPAETVASDERTVAAVASLLDECTDETCDPFLDAAVSAGELGRIGQPVSLK